ncbi:hypothetical protein P7K49_015285, partial [Saguinus oedipus]
AVGLWFPPTPFAKLSLGAWSFSFPRQPRPPAPAPAAPSGPRLAPGPGEKARRGSRPGHCAAGAWSCGRARPAPLPGLLGWAQLPGPRTRGALENRPLPEGPQRPRLRAPGWRPYLAPGAPRCPLSGSKEGSLVLQHRAKRRFRPARHPRARTHPALAGPLT